MSGFVDRYHLRVNSLTPFQERHQQLKTASNARDYRRRLYFLEVRKVSACAMGVPAQTSDGG